MMISNELKKLLNKYIDEFDIWPCFENKTLLITGANGVLGKGIISLLLFANTKFDLNIHIYASIRHLSALKDYIEKGDPVTFIHYGKEKDELLDNHIDYLIHAACPTDRNVFIKYPNDVFLTILHDTERMLDLSTIKGSKMLYLSSDAEYGSWSSDLPIDESSFGPLNSLNYRSCYPLGKKASEHMCYSSFYQNNTNVVIARPSIILGLFQKYDDSKVMSYFLRCLIQKENITLNTPGDSIKPMIFTLDAATACLFLLLYGKAGEAYNITNKSICMSIRDYAEALCNKYGNGIEIKYNYISNSKAGFAATSKLPLNTDKIMALGWRPIINLYDLFDIELRRFCAL